MEAGPRIVDPNSGRASRGECGLEVVWQGTRPNAHALCREASRFVFVTWPPNL